MLDHYEAAKKALSWFSNSILDTMNFDDPNAYDYLAYSPLVTITSDSHFDKNTVANPAAILWSLFYIEDNP
jgi:hypothetical protein